MSVQTTKYSPLSQNPPNSTNPNTAEIVANHDNDCPEDEYTNKIINSSSNNNNAEEDIDYNNSKKLFFKQICLLITLCALCSFVVFLIWTFIYDKEIHIPPKITEFPRLLIDRAEHYIRHLEFQNSTDGKSATLSIHLFDNNLTIDEFEHKKPSKFGNYIYSREEEKYRNATGPTKLICYYSTPIYKTITNTSNVLLPHNIDPYLCTHINVGIVRISNCTLELTDDLIETFKKIDILRKKNTNLKVLLWVGGAGFDSIGFREMTSDHGHRKIFIRSLKSALETYYLDGIDIDWEFPNGFNKERMHFSQLLHEIRREYQREHRTYLLSVAVTGIPTLIDMSYHIQEINDNVDYVNVMTYDYHFYDKATPWTGLNAPLYKRHNEVGFFATLNINYTVHYLVDKGIERSKIIIGLPTYGHSYKLVNPFNVRLGAPAMGYGSVGKMGFASYSEVCWFKKRNFAVISEYNVDSCSPYLYSGTEWISYDDELSLECKTNYIKEHQFGGAMVFSLNADDFVNYCGNDDEKQKSENSPVYNFPLLKKVHSILFKNQTED